MIGHLFDTVNAWSGLIESGVGVIGGWYGNVARNRIAKKQEQLTAGQQALALVEQTRELIADHIQRIDVLTHQLWARDDVIQEVYAQAIAARLVVHELDANDGRTPRQFEPLPAYPAEPAERTNAVSATRPAPLGV